MSKIKTAVYVIFIVFGVWACGLQAAAGSIYESPYVTFSPDGLAFTTNAGDRNVQWYKADGSDNVLTGKPSMLSALQKGEHYYQVERTGMVPVGKWVVALSNVHCCHNAYPRGGASTGSYHGVEFVKDVCLQPHFSGWYPVCADCGEIVAEYFFYMSKEAARSIDSMKVGDGICYYYLCPFNKNLEQGIELPAHRCKAVSANRYRVEYCANTTGAYGGYMQPSFHMYGNAEWYEGRKVTPQTCLNKNMYHRIGWKFNGWNTQADGGGVRYEDGAEILNLCEEDYGTEQTSGNIKLYAMWVPCSGTLEIDPAGGKYRGDERIFSLTRDYQSIYEIDPKDLDAPKGNTVFFDTGGAEAIAPITGTMHFAGWAQTDPFLGKLQENKYLFCAPDGHTDRITARYGRDPIKLPTPIRENRSFGGWYYDTAFTKPAGKAGDDFVPTEDITLHAQWVELLLEAKENYAVYDGAGAVDLSWSQPDGQEKTYKLYQKKEGEDWKKIYTNTKTDDELPIAAEFFYSGSEDVYTVEHTGFYKLTGYGAQGADWEDHFGGDGGRVEGSFWLEKGEKLKVCVGGTNGYNGGGAGDRYANGGGCTTVYSDRKGLLLVAGGGGGAAPNENGYAGGQGQSLVSSGMDGETGACGGGGGFLGGKAGELIVHRHVKGVCNHVHKGKNTAYGGCYTIPVACGRALKAVYTGTTYWKWGGTDTIHCPNCGADATKGEDCIGHTADCYDHVCPVHGNQKSNNSLSEPKTCEVLDHYAPGCGKTEKYTCGYPYDNYIISSKPAYGGSSYINAEYARYYAQDAGVRKGDGRLVLEAEDIGYYCDPRLDEVLAPDRDAPEKIAPDGMRKSSVDEKTILLEWEKPMDRGTVYHHRAESYTLDGRLLCTSNITENRLVSGIKGYYYCLDDREDTDAKAEEEAFLASEKIQIDMQEQDRYFHIRAVDVAGNLSETAHIRIGSVGTGDGDVDWPIFTEQVQISEGDNVYKASGEKTYYVKSDGETPILLGIGAHIKGPATADYQVDRIIVGSGQSEREERSRNILLFPKQPIQTEDITIWARDMELSFEGMSFLHAGNYRNVVRSDGNKKIFLSGEFVPDKEADGMTLDIVPVAGVGRVERIVYSDYSLDVGNGIRIICDGTAPRIDGLEIIENVLSVDRRDGEILLRLSAEDDLSGVRDFSMEIHNSDNDAREWYVPGDNGIIEVNITEDEPIFSGDFTVTVYACDNVGNDTVIEYSTTEFDLQVGVERILEPHDPVFKQGESGILRIVTWGYAERVEIEFPTELSRLDENLNHVYVYDSGQRYRQEEQYQFMIPLYAGEQEQYIVTVRAYKGDKMLELHPAFDVLGVRGTVLDELRTRLR